MGETAAQRRAREQKLQAEKTKQAEADARARQAEADARARQVEAETRREEARIAAEAEQRRQAAQQQQAELAARQETERRQAAERQAALDRENDPLQKGWKVAVNLSAPVAGYMLGKKMAEKIEARHVLSQQALGVHATKVAKSISRDIGLANKPGKAAQAALDRLHGAVVTAERSSLNRVKGPLGLVTAGLLLGEGAFSRFYLAPGIENPIARDTVSSLGVGSLFAASALVGQRLLSNASPTTVINPNAAAKLEAARATLARLRPEALAAAPDAAKVASRNKVTAAGALLLTAGAGIYSLLPTRAKAAEPEKPAGPVSATGNAPGAPAPDDGNPSTLTKAAVHLATALPQTAPIVQAAKDPKLALDLGVGALTTAGTVQAARMLNPAARAGAKLLTKAMLPLTAALAAIDTVKGFEKDGVKGAALGLTDSLTGGLVSLGLEKSGLKQPAQPTPPVAPQAVVSDRLDVARAAAVRTAAEMATASVAGSLRIPAAEIRPDGMTDDYFRIQNGKRVQVSGYRTPTR